MNAGAKDVELLPSEAVKFPESDALQKQAKSSIKYACVFCKYQASGQSVLQGHMFSAHAELLPDKRHMAEHTASGNKRLKHFACADCDFKASQNIHLEQHVNAVHRGLRPYECPDCDFRATYKHVLQRHIGAVHRPGQRPYECSECDYTAARRSHMNDHFNVVHKGTRPHACPECDYRSSKKAQIRYHVNAVHKGLRPFACSECEYKASEKGVLQKHVRRVHRGLGSFACSECDYKVSKMLLLKRHFDSVHSNHLKPDVPKEIGQIDPLKVTDESTVFIIKEEPEDASETEYGADVHHQEHIEMCNAELITIKHEPLEPE